MLFRQLNAIFFAVFLTFFALQAYAQNCTMIEEALPPFHVVNSKNALNRSAPGGKPVFFPKGTIVKVDPSTWTRVPFTTYRYQSIFTFMPSVKVLSVPDVEPDVVMSADHQRAHQDETDSGVGQRAYVGMVANINGVDLNPVFMSKNTPDVDSPANMIFEVRKDAGGVVDPSLRGRALKLEYEADSQKFVVQRCCPTNIPSQYELIPGVHHPMERDRQPNCRYMPSFEVLKPIDRGAGQPLSFAIERKFSSDCDSLAAALSPVDAQNQRAIFMLSHVLNEPDQQSLERLQRAAWATAKQARRKTPKCGGTMVYGNDAKCWCKQGVNETLAASGWGTGHIPGDDAINAAKYLPSMGFANVTAQIHTAAEAPPGSILVYRNTRGGSGHIEIKVDHQTYCSDFCKDAPINSYIPTRQLVGIFVKKT